MNLNNPFNKDVEMPQLSSLIDVLFLLLVFFMLTTTFDKGEGEIDTVDLEMPLADRTHRIVEPGDALEVAITKDGNFSVSGEPVSADAQLLTAIEQAYRQAGQLVVIAGDKDAPYQSIVKVFDVLQRLGIDEFTHVVRSAP